ncbi:hypothetical protein [Metaclostridioides mangenotii]|uniref:hypothetical protein n=1 Tax=Metaclostridioides mangenotii TaxID=1540 RepID=UPI00046726D4|nr:hypothetical protein [Clostridioides mangenotii]
MLVREENLCFEISQAINESIYSYGYVNKNDLKGYVNFIFEIEGIKSKNRDKMKDFVYERVLKSSEYFLKI